MSSSDVTRTPSLLATYSRFVNTFTLFAIPVRRRPAILKFLSNLLRLPLRLLGFIAINLTVESNCQVR